MPNFKILFPIITSLAYSLAISPSLAQETFQSEIVLANLKLDYSSGNKITVRGLAGRIHFEKVNTDRLPYKEATFITQTSSLIIGGSNPEYEYAYVGNPVVKTQSRNIGVELIDRDSGFTLFPFYGSERLGSSPNPTGYLNGNLRSISLGKYIGQTEHISLDYSETHIATSMSTTKMPSYGLSYKAINLMPNNSTTSFNFGLHKQNHKRESYTGNITKEGLRSIDVAAEYFFNRSFSLGVGITLASGEIAELEGKTLSLLTTYFITPRTAIDIELNKFTAKDQLEDDIDSLLIALTGRF